MDRIYQHAHEIERLAPWFQNLHLPDGSQTAPAHALGDFPSALWQKIEPFVPPDLDGWTALDIGCNAGFYSFELARRGAQVTAIDGDPHCLRQARWAATQLGLESAIEFHEMQVYDLARWSHTFDLVCFMDVFYRLRYPLLALDIVRQLTGRMLVFQTMTVPGDELTEPPADCNIAERELILKPSWPKMAFIERAMEGDLANWWAADHACVEALLRTAGFERVRRIAPEIYLAEPSPFRPTTAGESLGAQYQAASGSGRWDEQPGFAE